LHTAGKEPPTETFDEKKNGKIFSIFFVEEVDRSAEASVATARESSGKIGSASRRRRSRIDSDDRVY